MSGQRGALAVIIGGEPRVDLLPTEIKARKETRRRARGLLALVAIVAVLCAGGVIFATSIAAQSQQRLLAAQSRTQALLQEQLQYADARTAQNLVAMTTDARLVGMANEIYWREYLSAVRATLPSEMMVTLFTVDSLSALDATPVPDLPLQQPRVATLTLTATSPGLAQIDQWLVNLRTLPGHADSYLSQAALADGIYTASVNLNISADAFEKRFFDGYVPGEVLAPAEEEPAEDEATTEDEG